jgi:hypothetical protein
MLVFRENDQAYRFSILMSGLSISSENSVRALAKQSLGV